MADDALESQGRRLAALGAPLTETTIPCRFEVASDTTVVLRMNGHAYTEPDAAAWWIIERAF